MKVLIGKKYLHNTFAGIKVVSKIIELEADKTYTGHLIRKSDINQLKKAGVPYSGKESPEDCVGVVYDWQIIKKVR